MLRLNVKVKIKVKDRYLSTVLLRMVRYKYNFMMNLQSSAYAGFAEKILREF